MAVSFKRGYDVEDRVRTKLENVGCRIDRTPVWDHKYKLDFVVLSFPDNPAIYSCGVQVTTKVDDFEKQQEFLQVHLTSRVTQKSLYIELEDGLDLEEGGTISVLSTLMEFQFNRAYATQKIAAARIYSDLTYQFYDLSARVDQLRRRLIEMVPKPRPAGPAEVQQLADKWQKGDAVRVGNNGAGPAPVPEPPAGPHQSGVIDVYYRQGGNGFIHGEMETYFFHVNYVVDEELRDILNGLPMSAKQTVVQLPVTYVDMGQTRSGARYKEARFVKMKKTV